VHHQLLHLLHLIATDTNDEGLVLVVFQTVPTRLRNIQLQYVIQTGKQTIGNLTVAVDGKVDSDLFGVIYFSELDDAGIEVALIAMFGVVGLVGVSVVRLGGGCGVHV
jgi:hypothetical protein